MKLPRREFLKACTAGPATLLADRLGASLPAADNPAPAKPNIVFILTDDQRWDTIRALGNPEIHTPNLDRLVTQGFHFTNAYCMGSMIEAVCLPSRTMLATGRSLWHIPKNPRAQTPPNGVPLLPVLLNEAGYETFHSGKAGNACTFSNAAFHTNIETRTRDAQSATEHADNVIRFLRAHDGGKPFFIYLAPPVPHDPRLAPPEFVKLYDPGKITLSKNFLPEHPFDNGELKVRDEMLAAHPRTPEEMRQHLADYYATVSHLDYEVGRILAAVKERGWADNTVVIYSSDQGLAVGGRHGLMGKQNLYEHVKPPLIFAGPGIPCGRSDALVYLYDLFPTICDLAGAKVPSVVEGRSLLPVILGTQPRVRDWLLGAYRDCQRMIRDERWKLLEYNAGGARNTQLFDLHNDPDELRNRAADPEQAELLKRLRFLLVQAQRQFDDPCPTFLEKIVPAAAVKDKAAKRRAKNKTKQ
ncbi:MAG: sulfatase-like hydrolase/transferase [Planctomycetes bacterium]|jgi:arylsulfatase A-like enzyme|nr:sulfatase-like hydrolase/transferase [Planctomycetota bacterium]